jgi:hypothetical protein
LQQLYRDLSALLVSLKIEQKDFVQLGHHQ